jgi:hypothetical protein
VTTFSSESSAVMVMILLPTLSGMAGMNQFDEPCAIPAPLLDTQLTCTVPEPPETVPLIETEDAVVELAAADLRELAREQGLERDLG